MWKLWIISVVLGSEEPKYTLYDTYETKMNCQIEWHLITMDFTEGEVAYCEGKDD